MPTLSTFQCLPLHINKKIATFYTCALKANDSDLAWRTDPHAWRTLYNVSYSWHVLALQYFLDEANLNISTKHPSGQLKYYGLPKDIALDPQHHNYVSRVFISHPEDVPLIENKTFIERLLAAWPVNIVFPFARFLTIDLGEFMLESDNTNYLFDTKQLHLLYQHIQSTVPKLQDIMIRDYSNSIERYRYLDWRRVLTSIFSSIYNNASLIFLDRDRVQLANRFLFSSAETGLTQIDCTISDKGTSFNSIIKRSAPTLLSISNHGLNSLSPRSFIIDDDGNPIVYPRLQKLYFNDIIYIDYSVNTQIDKSIVFFPALRHLAWRLSYIFRDDALFRGNSNTLEYLDINVDVRLANLLEKHKVFSNGRYSKLQYISFRKTTIDDDQTFSDHSFENFVVDSIGPETRYLQHSVRKLSYINSIMHKSPFLKNIQVLSLSKFKGKLGGLLDAIRLLPNLTKLQCASGKFDFKPYSIQFKEFIGDYHKEHYPLSLRFRRWDVEAFSEANASMAHTGLAFAILCPNFALVSVNSNYEEDYKSEIRKTLECGLFNKYADSIKPLLKHKQHINDILGEEDY